MEQFSNESANQSHVNMGGRSICRWTGNEVFLYGISRFWEKCGRETVFSTLDGAGNYCKNNEESEFEVIKYGFPIFGHLSKNIVFLF